MTHPAQETKIELVTEAIETLVLAQTVALTQGGPVAHEQLVLARQCVKEALREFMAPALRIVERASTYQAERAALESIPAPDARPAYPVA